MKLDHVSYACGPEGLTATAERISATLGLRFVKGGVHPRFGTRNVFFPLRNHQYLEVVEVLDHPATMNQPFGRAVRERSEMGGGWMGWVVSVDEMTPIEGRLGRGAVPGSRKFPDGRELTWRQIGINGLINDPQLPYFICWDDGYEDLHPSNAEAPDGEITGISISGNRDRIVEWLGYPDENFTGDVQFTYTSPSGTPGLQAVTLDTPLGEVTL